MKISRADIRSAMCAYVGGRPSSTAAAASDTAEAGDRLETAASLGPLARTTEPFYRADLVAKLGRKISEGRYFVPSDQIVDMLLGRLIVEAAQRA